MVRRHGWAGSPPADEHEARTRIIEAAMRCVVETDPAQFTLSDVATDLGVTRQTVYRYFGGTDELFVAVGQVAVEVFFDELTVHLAGITDPSEWVVEALAATIEWLPTRRYLTLLVTAGRADSFTRTFSSRFAMQRGREFLARSDVDWAAAGYDDPQRDELIELMLRTTQSMVTDPPVPARTGVILRRFLRRWIAPAVAAAPLNRG
jgi:AcrR family transcriptional regulator